jgi:hypothetical protein
MGVQMSANPLSAKPARTRMNPAQHRYLQRFLPAMATYIVVLLAVIYVFDTAPPDGALKYALASLPALPLVAVIVILAMYLREETDEFVRMHQSLALLGGLGITLATTTVWGFLEFFADAPHLNAFLFFPGFCLAYGVATGVLAWVYR